MKWQKKGVYNPDQMLRIPKLKIKLKLLPQKRWNKLASPEATQVRNYISPIHRLTNVDKETHIIFQELHFTSYICICIFSVFISIFVSVFESVFLSVFAALVISLLLFPPIMDMELASQAVYGSHRAPLGTTIATYTIHSWSPYKEQVAVPILLPNYLPTYLPSHLLL